MLYDNWAITTLLLGHRLNNFLPYLIIIRNCSSGLIARLFKSIHHLRLHALWLTRKLLIGWGFVFQKWFWIERALIFLIGTQHLETLDLNMRLEVLTLISCLRWIRLSPPLTQAVITVCMRLQSWLFHLGDTEPVSGIRYHLVNWVLVRAELLKHICYKRCFLNYNNLLSFFNAILSRVSKLFE